ncbi:MAG: 50S ribosomal protein L11 methyltransferase [Pseudomonadota bacterium]
MTERLTLRTPDRDVGFRAAGFLEELAAPSPTAVSIFEADGGWQVDAYVDGLDEAGRDGFVAALVSACPDAAGLSSWEPVPDENWVAISQSALPPVEAGRFVVHGTHDRDRIPHGPLSIEIDAGEAFGTAHHATTYGCLIALSRIANGWHPARVLDLGTGSGVLAIAAARLWPRAAITATDLDADAVRIARENAVKNGVGARVRPEMADGVPTAGAGAAYDCVVANILAGPLIELATNITRATAPGGRLLLSGILLPQAPAVLAAYTANGFALARHDRVEGWSILTLRRRDTRRVRAPAIDLD